MTTRRELADQIDHLDAEIDALQKDKRELFAAYREATDRAECKAVQAAIKRRQKVAAGKGAEIDAHDARVDEIFVEITADPSRAHVARGARTREAPKSAAAFPPVSEGKGQVKDAADEAPAAAVAEATSFQGQSVETAGRELEAASNRPQTSAPSAILERPNVVAPAEPFDIGDIPAFLDRKNWVDGKPPLH